MVILGSEIDGSLSFRYCQQVRPFGGELVLRKESAVSGQPKCWQVVFKDICSCSPKKRGVGTSVWSPVRVTGCSLVQQTPHAQLGVYDGSSA